MEYIILPAVAAFVGWITNVIAIKLLFRPHEPVRIPILGIEIQGVLPRRKRAIAKAIAEVVEEELLSKNDVWAKLESPEIEDALVRRILSLIEKRVKEAYPSWFPETFLFPISYFLNGWLERKLREAIPEIRDKIREEVLERLTLKDIVEGKVNAFDFKEFEGIVMRVASRELRFVEIAGGVLGLLIGFIQLAIIKLMG
ncbi:MAG: DUF445 family protein [Synergistetes bacterium]|nr:MAG: Uncharacterized protein XD52_0630 [bacterium 42_11]MBC7332107.1 DUF445 family protein [Synergistota bacterium]